MKLATLITSTLSLTTSLVFASQFGQLKRFNSQNVRFTVQTKIADAPDYSTTIDGNFVEVANNEVTTRLGSLAATLDKYENAHNCGFAPLTIGPIAATGSLKNSQRWSMMGTSYKVKEADFDQASTVAKAITLPRNWQTLCKSF